MSSLQPAIFATYYGALFVLVCWALHRAHLAYGVRGTGRVASLEAESDAPLLTADAQAGSQTASYEPVVTVQLPMFNERYVAERVIRAVAALDYPSALLEIQVLDDSTDATCAIVDRVVAELVAQGCDIKVLRRATREGFKAGALAVGMAQARGELIAIFDADFVPGPDFLRRVVPHLSDREVGVVQAGWSYLNRESNFLTRAQALLLDGHFMVEQPGRFARGHYFNFNGTAGIWRRGAIEQAGGWQHDTITEDLDLSYRAQLAGWRFIYLSDYAVPSELPADIGAFRTQQHRWAKGSTECLRKLRPALLRGRAPRGRRFHAFMHLSANLNYLATLVVALLMPLVAASREELASNVLLYLDLILLTLGFGAVGYFYSRALRSQPQALWRRVVLLVFAMAVDIGMSVIKARGALEAIVGHRSAFVRTPKHALVGTEASPVAASPGYLRIGLDAGVVELGIAGWLLWGILRVSDDDSTSWFSLPFLMLFFVGFGFIGALCLTRVVRLARQRRALRRVEA